MEYDASLPWKKLSSESGQDLILFKSRFDYYENVRNNHRVKAVILQAPDWVNIVALTPQRQVVIVQQYRFGTQQMTSEIPAGIVDQDETPAQAARRELLEETGYTSQDWTAMDYVEPNPAFLNNKCYFFLARNAQKTHSTRLDDGENIRTLTMPERELRKEIEQGHLRHSLALAALTRVFDIWKVDTP